MPVFEGAQGAGKSRLLSILGGPYYAELTEGLDSKDFFIALQGTWLVEVAELDAFRRTDIRRIKQVLSSCQDRCRLPYGKHAVDLPRRAVFAGTTNEHEYLRDHTGARRFWPVTVGAIDHGWLSENRTQLFAEAVEMLRSGATWWHIPAAEAREQAEERREADPWESVVAEFCLGRHETTSAEVLAHLGLDLARQGKAEQMRVSQILPVLGYKRYLRRRGGKPVRVWVEESVADLDF
jgi:predicted P-loop ATPase